MLYIVLISNGDRDGNANGVGNANGKNAIGLDLQNNNPSSRFFVHPLNLISI